jgi:TetR/AcrR family transcriptional regulator, mexJK operon transcriptional repressor
MSDIASELSPMTNPEARADQAGGATGLRRADTITDERRHEILVAARDVFLEEGFGNATMLAVARRARASKETLYGLYGSKEKLFVAIIREASCGLARTLVCPDAACPREALTDFARRYMDMVTTGSGIALIRVAVAEVGRFPELGRIMVEQGFEPIRTVLANYMQAAGARGDLAIEDPRAAASMFISILKSDWFLWRLLDAVPPPSAEEIDAVAARSVNAFLKIYAPSVALPLSQSA